MPAILGIAGLPTPMPVQSFGMGIGGNPNLSRQSRRLYIGSITPEVNEQNLTDFFNAKMAEMNLGTATPGNPVLAVQCNYEKNYAFVEVRVPFTLSTPSNFFFSSVVLKMPPLQWPLTESFSSTGRSRFADPRIMAVNRL